MHDGFPEDYYAYLSAYYGGPLQDLICDSPLYAAVRCISAVANIRVCDACERDTEDWTYNTYTSEVLCTSCTALCGDMQKCSKCGQYAERRDMAHMVTGYATEASKTAAVVMFTPIPVCPDCTTAPRHS